MIVTSTAGNLAATGLTWNLASDLRQLFEFHFMVNAFRAGTIVAVVAGAIGWFMVLRRQTFAGHTLALTAFPGAAGAIWLGLSATLGYFVATTASALVIASAPGPVTGQTHSQESAIIGTVQAFVLACGVLFVSLYKGFLNSVTDLLFGTFLGITDGQVMTLLIAGVIAVGGLCVIGRPLFFASIDPEVAAARGVPVRLLSVLFLVLLGFAVAEATQITGVLLVFALLVMPARRCTADHRPPGPQPDPHDRLRADHHVDGPGRGLLLPVPDRLLRHRVRIRHLRRGREREATR